MMNPSALSFRFLTRLASIAGLALGTASLVLADPFVFRGRDLLLGIRQPDAVTEMIVNLGHASNYFNARPGSVIVVDQFSRAQLDAAFSNFDGLRWSVCGAKREGEPEDLDPEIPATTVWVTRPRRDQAVKTAAWLRRSLFSQGGTANKIFELGNKAFLASDGNPSDPIRNTPTCVFVAAGQPLSYGDVIGTQGNLDGGFQGIIENNVGSPFADARRSDLYELRPSDGGTPPGTHLGYFEFRPDGTMIFQAAGGEVVAPPAAPLLTVGTVSSNRVDFSWTNVSGEDGYRLERRAGASGTWEVTSFGANVASGSVTGLTEKTEYFFRIVAFNQGGNSAYSAEISATTLANEAASLPAPRIVSYQLSGALARLTVETANDPSVQYSLHFTNKLGAPMRDWPKVGSVLSGNGQAQVLEHGSADPARFYGVATSR